MKQLSVQGGRYSPDVLSPWNSWLAQFSYRCSLDTSAYLGLGSTPGMHDAWRAPLATICSGWLTVSNQWVMVGLPLKPPGLGVRESSLMVACSISSVELLRPTWLDSWTEPSRRFGGASVACGAQPSVCVP